ncbi:MAG: bifunctional folylpolyglutamate synthase/dihydrofolate synthase [Cyclobacteriaceae bacterium]|nr:bifunctional folylpolyglutamate synthase/dihydrofolate synthase [Cyclobacteriaceae bacterium]
MPQHPRYRETIDFLYANIPMFQRVGAAAYRKDLTNTIALCKALDNPERKFKSVHVAGTNGKGSSSHMLAAALQKSGYRTGLYTSPHLKEFTERIKVNGEEVREDFVVGFVDRIRPIIGTLQPSFFEITVAMAFSYFENEKVDVAVIEVGMGGRLDSTNVITPVVSLITNIGMDHTDFLGNTLVEIAGEKAGIIKPGVPVVISERQDEVEAVFTKRAHDLAAPISFASDVYEVEVDAALNKFLIFRNGLPSGRPLAPDLIGNYQRKNIAGVCQTLDVLRGLGWQLPDQPVLEGLEQAARLTGLKGRWQVLASQPLVVADTGHNEPGIREVLKQIGKTPHRNLHWVFGMVRDKSPDKILALLPSDARYYFCQATIPRALEATSLAEAAARFGLQGTVVPDVNRALHTAEAHASPEDLILVGGSTFVVAELHNL